MEQEFEAGLYYVGDPCYVVADKDWGKLLDKFNFFEDNSFEYHDEQCWAAGTAYGDGCFEDNFDREYGVDAGLLGIVPVSACDKKRLNTSGAGGQVIRFDERFLVWEMDGKFHFGNVVINTN